MTRENIRQKIYDYMLHKGADRFWANAALKHIMLNFAGNTFWLADIRDPKVIIGAYGMINKFTVKCSINTESQKVDGKLIYTFGHGHKVRVTETK
jgi:hypothetical protein